jgi:hypothetical protein
MSKPITKREIPDGFQLEWDNTTWNVGFVFIWSDVYECYLQQGQITVKPGDTLTEAFERVVGEPLFSDREVFFVKE